MNSLGKVWDTAVYRPEVHWEAMQCSVKTLRTELPEEDLKKYFTTVYKFIAGVYLFDSLQFELEWLPQEAKKASQELLEKLTLCCGIPTNNFEEYCDGEVPLEDRILPHPGTINARLILYSLENGLDCPEGDSGLAINRTLRYSLYEMIEMALRTKYAFKIEQNSFLKNFTTPGNRRLTARDFFDSLTFYDQLDSLVPDQLKTSEAVCNFFDKMRQLSNFSSKES